MSSNLHSSTKHSPTPLSLMEEYKAISFNKNENVNRKMCNSGPLTVCNARTPEIICLTRYLFHRWNKRSILVCWRQIFYELTLQNALQL